MRNLASPNNPARVVGFVTMAILLITAIWMAPGCRPAAAPVAAQPAAIAEDPPADASPVADEDAETGAATAAATSLPLLLDLGATKCIPCKLMAPILEELESEYAGRMDVVFIDVWEDNAAAEKHGIGSIPTQIFFDAAGRELFRHEGFISKEDILAKWKELGFDFAGSSRSEASEAAQLPLLGPEQSAVDG